MKVESRYVGTPLKDYQTEISWREIMNYAAAIGDQNPVYFDDERAGGIVAHPMQSVATTWPVLERIWEYIELEDFPQEILATQVHYSEHLILHRLMRPGDRITLKGRIAAILPHRAGTHMINCLEAFDQHGAPIFTEYIGALMRGVECLDEGAGNGGLPVAPKFNDTGAVCWDAAVKIDPLLPFIYDGCTRIHFPIHTSKQFAHQVGLPDIILQGTATLALAVSEIVQREAGADPSRVRAIACRFTGMVLPGSTIRVQMLSRHADGDLHFQVLNGQGQRAISHGYMKLDV